MGDQLPHLRRAVRWQPIVGAGVASAVLALADIPPEFVVAVFAGGLSYVLDDPAEAILDATPAGPRPRRRAIRLGLAVPVAAAMWLGVVQPLWGLRPGAPPSGTLDLLVAALVAVVLAAAAAGWGVAGAPLAMALVVGGRLIPSSWIVNLAPDQTRNWSIVLGLAVAAVILLSRDPARRRS